MARWFSLGVSLQLISGCGWNKGERRSGCWSTWGLARQLCLQEVSVTLHGPLGLPHSMGSRHPDCFWGWHVRIPEHWVWVNHLLGPSFESHTVCFYHPLVNWLVRFRTRGCRPRLSMETCQGICGHVLTPPQIRSNS